MVHDSSFQVRTKELKKTLRFSAPPAIPTSLSSMHTSVQGHPNTRDVVRSGATEEQCQTLEILRKTPSTHGCSRKDVLLEADLILEISLRQWCQNISRIDLVSMRYATSMVPLLRGTYIVKLLGAKKMSWKYTLDTRS